MECQIKSNEGFGLRNQKDEIVINRYVKGYRRSKFVGEYQDFGFEYIEFEMIIRYLNGEVKLVVDYLYVGFLRIC